MLPDKKLIDEQHKQTIDLWVEHAVHPGSGFTAILENNLKETFARADEMTMKNLPHIVAYLYWDCPGACWGSPAKVKAWRGTTAEIL